MKNTFSLCICCLALSMPFATVTAYEDAESAGVSCEQEAMDMGLATEETEQYIAECEQRTYEAEESEPVDPEAVQEDETDINEQES